MNNYQKSLLLANIKQSVVHWFLAGGQHIAKAADCAKKWSYEHSAFQQIQTANVEILLHGLRSTNENKEQPFMNEKNSFAEFEPDTVRKLIEDFEWVRRTTQIHDAFKTTSYALPSAGASLSATTATTEVHYLDEPRTTECSSTPVVTSAIKRFFFSWIERNLKSNCLRACLQTLIADTELLNLYYESWAFLRSQKYSTALLICLSALELNRYSFLSQLDADLLQAANASNTSNAVCKAAKHKRSSSHPNFSLSPPKKISIPFAPRRSTLESKKMLESRGQRKSVHSKVVFPTFRKTKSLPELQTTWKHTNSTDEVDTRNRPRSKTITGKFTQKPPMPKSAQHIVDRLKSRIHNDQMQRIFLTPSNTSSSYSDDDALLSSASASSRYSQISDITLHSNSTMNSNSVSTASDGSKTTARHIEVIKCDDIKIWTDQSTELRSQSPRRELLSPNACTASYDIPQKSIRKSAKSVSPINSFLASLFKTPPTYTSWALRENVVSSERTDCSVAIDEGNATVVGFPCEESSPIECIKSGSVFDAFLPAYGKKLRSRPSQNLFEDGISTLDYSAPSGRLSSEPIDTASTSFAHNYSLTTLKSCESLTSFLQLSHLSRNNTELEKENAHFRISEAIISAIEHIKWAKMHPDKRAESTSSVADTAIGGNWLQQERCRTSSVRSETDTTNSDVNEHIPYAELGDGNGDLLSAEVVGLALISKFNDKQLPKVSKLKWLVSDGDTPQNLLPMPDTSLGANPDENVIPAMTRGTRYWAPPRPQIIFTDHPVPNRKQLIRKQNYRCAGCGMRVSAQLLHSFRYCSYLDKYHCTGCHRNQICSIPAKILHNWDFKCYPVSVFAYRLLEQMFTHPLFYVPDLNPSLYINNKVLLEARNKRMQLRFTKDFISTCRFASREQHYFDVIPEHITADVDMWAMADFFDVRMKSMKRSIDELIARCEEHIFQCVLCTARGFFCEYCRNSEVIFPWSSKTYRCDRCGSCFHMTCWKSMLEICQRCQRLQRRQLQQLDDEF